MRACDAAVQNTNECLCNFEALWEDKIRKPVRISLRKSRGMMNFKIIVKKLHKHRFDAHCYIYRLFSCRNYIFELLFQSVAAKIQKRKRKKQGKRGKITSLISRNPKCLLKTLRVFWTNTNSSLIFIHAMIDHAAKKPRGPDPTGSSARSQGHDNIVWRSFPCRRVQSAAMLRLTSN